jgi:hypothetical protein
VLRAQLLDRLLLSPPCPTLAAARDLTSALYRSARYYCSCGKAYCTRKHPNTGPGCPAGGQRISCQAEPVKDADGKFRVQFRLMDKQESIRWVVQKYGPDPNKWPYFARRKIREEK